MNVLISICKNLTLTFDDLSQPQITYGFKMFNYMIIPSGRKVCDPEEEEDNKSHK